MSEPARLAHAQGLLRSWRRLGRSLLLSAALVAPAGAEEVAELLARADAFRLPDAEARVELRVRLYEREALDKERHYTVYVRPGRRSLVLFRSAGESGQKVLMLDNDYWIFMPDTRRPIRITPLQKLLGEAATGDVATLTWSEDYSGRPLARNVSDGPCSEARPCVLLELHSARAGTTYERIELWLDEDGVPVHARLYLASGKLAKEASYTLGEVEGRRRITAMRLFDHINHHRRTEIDYLGITPVSVSERFFNPAFLARDNLEGW